jgi:dephospho-CoA kinase
MSFIHITGSAGSGKTSVCEELVRRGYTAFSADEDGISSFVENETGEASKFGEDTRGEEWYAKNSWNMNRRKVEEAAALAGPGKPVFLCGCASNDTDMYDIVTKVICLVAPKEVVEHRLATRTNNDYGKSDFELKQVLEWMPRLEKQERERGSFIVDASQPLENVVDEILRLTTTLNKEI